MERLPLVGPLLSIEDLETLHVYHLHDSDCRQTTLRPTNYAREIVGNLLLVYATRTSLRDLVLSPLLLSEDHPSLRRPMAPSTQESRTIQSQVDQTEIVYQSLRY
jgi:hypothetical protein